MNTAADRAMTWARFFGMGQNPVNKTNASRTIPRAYVEDDGGDRTLVYDWSIPLFAPVRKKDLVESFRMFLASAAEAIKDSPIFSADG